MSVKVVVGAQWGDEGKGKMVDVFAEKADLVVRYQGGDNAGHTVANRFGTFKLHLIPCGVFYPNTANLVGTGTVVNPDELLKEMAAIESAGVDLSKLYISDKAQILMPYHVALDGLAEKGKGGIGTTKRGIGPCYAGRALRTNLRFEDLNDLDYCKQRLEIFLDGINNQLEFGGWDEKFSVDDMVAKCAEWKQKLGSHIVNPFSLIHSYLDADKNILFEGQLGVMKDLDLGIYPYVTSSNPVSAYAAVSGGFPAARIDHVCGIMKAFSSAVGAGPFPTEMGEHEGSEMRGDGSAIDDEFGARTGRARRLGWLDLPVVKFAHMVNGFTEVAISKIDKLDQLDTIKVCTAYKLDGKVVDYMPSARDLYRVEPVYVEMPGWKASTSACKSIAELPENAKKYLALIEETCGFKIKYVGVGPEREDILL